MIRSPTAKKWLRHLGPAAIAIAAGIIFARLSIDYVGTEFGSGTLTGKLLTLNCIGTVLLLAGGTALFWKTGAGLSLVISGVLLVAPFVSYLMAPDVWQKNLPGNYSVPAVAISSSARLLSKELAVVLAEKFVAQNGYTDAASNELKTPVDKESIEWFEASGQMMQHRFNSLLPKAIGIRKGENDRWYVAFDYVDRSKAEGLCRVVTMDLDGRNIRMEHKSGGRKGLVGFSDH